MNNWRKKHVPKPAPFPDDYENPATKYQSSLVQQVIINRILHLRYETATHAEVVLRALLVRLETYQFTTSRLENFQFCLKYLYEIYEQLGDASLLILVGNIRAIVDNILDKGYKNKGETTFVPDETQSFEDQAPDVFETY
jgi:hypothetical protein